MLVEVSFRKWLVLRQDNIVEGHHGGETVHGVVGRSQEVNKHSSGSKPAFPLPFCSTGATGILTGSMGTQDGASHPAL